MNSNSESEDTKAREAEESGRQAGRKYDADFRRLYMTQYVAAGVYTTPVKEPKNPFRRRNADSSDCYGAWWRGYRETAYVWLSE